VPERQVDRVSVDNSWDNLDCWDVERRSDGAVVVRVHSRDRVGRPLPDAVFAFRQGDPQYEIWEQRLQQRRPPTDG
jgi:hypothetical protein